MAVLREVDPNLIEPAHNARRSVGDIAELTASVAATGVLQPLLVKAHPDEPGHFVLVAGARRRAAALAAERTTVPVIELDPGTDERLYGFIENLHRSDLSPLEKADEIRSLMAERHLNQTQVAEVTGIAQPTVSKLVRIRLRLHPELLERLHDGTLSVAKAATLIEHTHEVQLRMALAPRTRVKGTPRRRSEAELALSRALEAFQRGDEDAALELTRLALRHLEARRRNGSSAEPKVRAPGRPASEPAEPPERLSPGFPLLERQARARAEAQAEPPKVTGGWRPKVKCGDCKHYLTIEVGSDSERTLASHRDQTGCVSARAAMSKTG